MKKLPIVRQCKAFKPQMQLRKIIVPVARTFSYGAFCGKRLIELIKRRDNYYTFYNFAHDSQDVIPVRSFDSLQVALLVSGIAVFCELHVTQMKGSNNSG